MLYIQAAFSLLSFMSVSSGSNRAFEWLVNLSTTAGLTGWLVMNLTYIFFRMYPIPLILSN